MEPGFTHPFPLIPATPIPKAAAYSNDEIHRVGIS